MKNLKKFIMSRFKDMYVMTADIKDIPKVNKNNLSFSPITDENIFDFRDNDYAQLALRMKRGGRFFAAYLGGKVVACGGIYSKHRNEYGGGES